MTEILSVIEPESTLNDFPEDVNTQTPIQNRYTRNSEVHSAIDYEVNHLLRTVTFACFFQLLFLVP